jgi:hypothetical protein
MAYKPHALLAWGGVIVDDTGAEREEWANTLRFETGFTDIGDQLARVAPLIVAYHKSAQLFMPGAVRLRYVKLNNVNEFGRYEAQKTYQLLVDEGGGAGGAPVMPWQIAVAVSLQSERRGPRGRGRFFLPVPKLTVDAKGRLNENFRNQMAGISAGLIASLNTSPIDSSSGNHICVQSKVDATASRVTKVRVGDVFDTQRRRRNDLLEAYVTSAVA